MRGDPSPRTEAAVTSLGLLMVGKKMQEVEGEIRMPSVPPMPQARMLRVPGRARIQRHAPLENDR